MNQRSTARHDERTRRSPGRAVAWLGVVVAGALLVAAIGFAASPTADDERPATEAPRAPAASADPAPALAGDAASPLPAPRAPTFGVAATAPAPGPSLEPPRSPPRPGTERAFYEDDLRLAARPGALAGRARQLFEGPGGDIERVAVLRALWDGADPDAGAWFGRALRPPADATPPMGRVSVAEFALVFLQDRAAREPAAMDLIAGLVPDVRAPLALRRSAAESVAALGDVNRLRQLSADLAGLPDPAFRAAVASASRRNENATEAAELFAALGVPEGNLPDTGAESP